MKPFEALFFLVAVQGYFLAVLLLLKRPRAQPAKLLSAFIALVSTEALLFHLLIYEPRWTHAVMANRPIWFLYGPVTYRFGREITGSRERPGAYNRLHAVPFLICILVLSVFFFPLDSGFKRAFLARYLAGERPTLDTVLSLAAVLHLTVYGIALQRYLSAHAQRGGGFFASTRPLKIRSLVVLVIVLWIAAGLLFCNWAFTFGDTGMTEKMVAGALFGIMATIVYAMGYFGLCRPGYFDTETLSQVYREVSEEGEAADIGNAAPSASDTATEAAACLKVISDYMIRERPFLNSEFTLQDLSLGLGIPAHKLSRAINRETGSNFFQLVNRYRIDAVKRQLSEPDGKNKTLLAVALDTGFNSKSTFNLAFKRIVGMTPTQYRKQLK